MSLSSVKFEIVLEIRYLVALLIREAGLDSVVS